METETLYFNASIPRVIFTKLLKPIWKDIIFSGMGTLVYKKNYSFDIKSPNEVLTRTLKGGICGTDLHLLMLDFSLDVTPTIIPSPNPRYLGHECVCEIVEIGKEVTSIKKGQRAVVQKPACCLIHQSGNLCLHCSQGNFWLCERDGQFATSSPYHAAGGWNTGFCYHENQLVVLPDSISNDQAILIEPLACSLRGILKHTPEANDKVLIIGAGTIGLCTLVNLRAVQPECDVTVLARHDFQADFARQFGATEVINEENILSFIEKKTNATMYKGELGSKTLIGGFDVIYDCVGSEKTIHNALKWTRGRGVVVMLGIDLHQSKLDLNPIWRQEVDLIGSMVHGLEDWKGKKIETFKIVIELLEKGKIPKELTKIITHRYPLSNYKEAIKTTMDKKKYNSVKVIFDYEL